MNKIIFSKIRRINPILVFILPGLLGFVVFYIWPFIISLGYAFIDNTVNGNFVGLKNFLDLFKNKPYLRGLKNTIEFIFICVPLNICISLGVAILIRRLEKYKELFTLIFLIPLVIPSGSMVFFWRMFFEYNGFLNNMLFQIGLEKINWLETSNVRYVIVMIFLWKNIGYNMILFLSALTSIPKEYYEAAKVDGAGPLSEFINITLINLVPTFFIVIIMSIINAFKVFKEIYLITGSYPHESIYMLQHFMNNMFSSLSYQKLTTATCILILIIGVLTQLLLKIEKEISK